MIMSWPDTALVPAGIIGSTVALIHGAITERLMVAPLLHFSTFNWFLDGPPRSWWRSREEAGP